MSYTNETDYLKLPQYIGTDVPSILVDFNGAMEKIDTAALQANENVTKAVQNSDQAKSLASAASAQSEANANSIGTLGTRVKSLEDTSGSSESEIAQVRQAAENAQNTANAAQTAARNAQTAAGNAQSTANNNTANISGLSNRVSKLETSGTASGVKATAFNGYFVDGVGARNFIGQGGLVLWGDGANQGYGDALIVGLLGISGNVGGANLDSEETLGGVTFHPLLMCDGNPFGVTREGANRQFFTPTYPQNSAVPSSNVLYMPLSVVYEEWGGGKTYIGYIGNDFNQFYNRTLGLGATILYANGRSV